MGLDAFVGDCYVVIREGNISAEAASEILKEAGNLNAAERILIAGKATVTSEAARIFAEKKVKLVGNESQTVGPEDAPMEVHQILLGAGVALLEGIVLRNVAEGKYLLSAAPLNLEGCEGAPCRAFLMRQ